MSTKNDHEQSPPTGKQIAAARALVGITQSDLARDSGLSKGTIAGYEAGRTTPTRANLAAMVAALERRGIAFRNGDSPTVTHHLKPQAP
ncbi:MAG: helix-turn-helix transcriptional regulator [Myxococcales bacterium]|nr:helix-turn-helix transcriptional regulator [Myxococcales bacterium]